MYDTVEQIVAGSRLAFKLLNEPAPLEEAGQGPAPEARLNEVKALVADWANHKEHENIASLMGVVEGWLEEVYGNIDRFEPESRHAEALMVMDPDVPECIEHLCVELSRHGWSDGYDFRSLKRTLKDLRREGYVLKMQGKYLLTAKGAAEAAEWRAPKSTPVTGQEAWQSGPGVLLRAMRGS